MLTYSRSKGLFAGVDLGGSWVERGKDSITALYAKDTPTADLLTGKVTAPAEARVFLNAVKQAVVDTNAG
jgi:lipid-binding SYLF domain-containing protein